jgi:hypothetical protein
VTHCTHLDDLIATCMPEDQSGVRVIRRHHLLVRCSHWLTLPLLTSQLASAALPLKKARQNNSEPSRPQASSGEQTSQADRSHLLLFTL